jgi:hypothetical protein
VNYVSPGSKERAEKVASEIEAKGTKAIVCQADVSKLDQIPRIVEAALKISPSGKIDILIHKYVRYPVCVPLSRMYRRQLTRPLTKCCARKRSQPGRHDGRLLHSPFRCQCQGSHLLDQSGGASHRKRWPHRLYFIRRGPSWSRGADSVRCNQGCERGAGASVGEGIWPVSRNHSQQCEPWTDRNG